MITSGGCSNWMLCCFSLTGLYLRAEQLLGEICRISPRFHSIIKITVLCINMLTNSHTRTPKCGPNIIISRVLNSAVRITMFTANYWCCKGGKLMHPLIKSDHKDRWTPRYHIAHFLSWRPKKMDYNVDNCIHFRSVRRMLSTCW